MFEIDKARFGALIAELRKEKGLTQKDLAQRLFISDKAVSKWETGASIPDTALLMPLAELLGVTVTELLLCRRGPQEPLNAGQVETLVQSALQYSAEETTRPRVRRERVIGFFLCLLAACAEVFLLWRGGLLPESLWVVELLSAFFGGYFWLAARERLPAYYDENRISSYSDGVFRMNMPGLHFNNSNWPHLIQVGRVWSLISLVGYPVLCYVLSSFCPAVWASAGLFLTLALFLGGLFVPMYVVGKRYE